MKNDKKRYRGNAVLRMVFVGLSIAFQVGWILLMILVLNDSYPWIEMITRILSVTVILQLNSKHTNSAYKMPWIMLIMAVPVMGLSLYLMMNAFGDPGNIGKRMEAVRKETRGKLMQESPDCSAGGLSYYLQHHIGCPAY